MEVLVRTLAHHLSQAVQICKATRQEECAAHGPQNTQRMDHGPKKSQIPKKGVEATGNRGFLHNVLRTVLFGIGQVRVTRKASCLVLWSIKTNMYAFALST